MATAVCTSLDIQVDSNGVPLAAGSVKVCDVGTTTAKNVWSDTALSVAASNPINLVGARHDMRYIATGTYKIIVYTGADGTGSVLYTRDNIDPGVPFGGTGILAIANGGTGAATAGAALTALGAASTAELTAVSATVAALAGASASTEETHIATGTTAQRDATPDEGDIRRNTTTSEWEGYNGAGWENFKTSSDATATADVKAETAEDTFIRPDRLKHSDRVAKAWALIGWSGGTPTFTDAFNFSGALTDTGTGDVTISFTSALPSANYAVCATSQHATENHIVTIVSKSTTQIRIRVVDDGNTPRDPTSLSVHVFGDFS